MISSQVSGVTHFSHASAKLCPSPRGGFDRAAAPPQILENPVKPGLPLVPLLFTSYFVISRPYLVGVLLRLFGGCWCLGCLLGKYITGLLFK